MCGARTRRPVFRVVCAVALAQLPSCPSRMPCAVAARALLPRTHPFGAGPGAPTPPFRLLSPLPPRQDGAALIPLRRALAVFGAIITRGAHKTASAGCPLGPPEVLRPPSVDCHMDSACSCSQSTPHSHTILFGPDAGGRRLAPFARRFAPHTPARVRARRRGACSGLRQSTGPRSCVQPSPRPKRTDTSLPKPSTATLQGELRPHLALRCAPAAPSHVETALSAAARHNICRTIRAALSGTPGPAAHAPPHRTATRRPC